MAVLQRLGDGREFQLLAYTLVGRSRRCDLVLTHASVSQMHASIRFVDGRWVLEDRNSKNGTWVDGSALSRSHGFSIEADSVLRFGARGVEEWRLIDASPPLDLASGSSTIRLERRIGESRLVIYDDLRLELTSGLITHRLKSRVPYLVIQALGRERLDDRSRGRSPDEEGWLDRRLLAERLQHRDINQDIHRIREDFQRLALFEDAESIVEDQREQSKVRLGIHDVSLR